MNIEKTAFYINLFDFNFKTKRSASLSQTFEKLAPIIPLDFIQVINATSVTERKEKFLLQLLFDRQIVSKALFPKMIPVP